MNDYDEGYYEADYDEDPLNDYCTACGHDLHMGDCYPPDMVNPGVVPDRSGLPDGFMWAWAASAVIPHWDVRWTGAA